MHTILNPPQRGGRIVLEGAPRVRRRWLLGCAAAATLTLLPGRVAREGVTVPVTRTLASVTPDEILSDRMDALLTGLAAREVFSGAALVARGAQVLLNRGYGWADLRQQAGNVPGTRFRVASITKQFTAMAILQLQARGLLHVGDRLSAYVDHCPATWAPITLHQLLTHTSGIPGYSGLPGYDANASRHLTPLQLIGVFRDAPLDFAPGTGWKYSGSGYVLLGYIVERLSGLPYAQFLRANILQPLGLTQTAVDQDHPSPPVHATGYASWGLVAGFVDVSLLYAAGSLASATGDLFRWNRALITGTPRLIPPAALGQMFTPYVLNDPTQPETAQAYGYGWFIGRQGPHRMIWHPGNINGFVSINAIYPDDGLSIVLLSNLQSADVRTTVEQLAGYAFDASTDCGTACAFTA